MADRKARWGLLSTARINERLIPTIHASARAELAAVGSRDGAKAEAYARKWNIPRAHGSYEALLADPDLDVIYLSLPNHLHAEWAVKAADAGKHVLCEKPLAMSTAEVDQIAEAAARNRVVIQEAAMMRFHAQIHYLADLVSRQAIGDVRLLRGTFTFLLENEADIRLDPTKGGGSLWDLGSYCVSFSRRVLGAEPVEVFAMTVPSRSGVDACLSGQMRFPGDALVQFFSSFASFANAEADLLGTQGRIELDVPWTNQLSRIANVRLTRFGGQDKGTFGDNTDSQVTETKSFENINAYQDEVDSMTASVLDGTPPVISLADSRNNVATIVALYTSAREGRSVKL